MSDPDAALEQKAWLAYVRQELTTSAIALVDAARAFARKAERLGGPDSLKMVHRIRDRAESHHSKVIAFVDGPFERATPDERKVLRHDLRGAVGYIVSATEDIRESASPALLAEFQPESAELLAIAHKVLLGLQNLLREGVAILNLPIILEGIADFAALSKNPDDLSELVRRRLGMYFVPELETRPGVLRALTLDPRLEQILGTKVHRSPTDVGLSLEPATGRHLIEELNRHIAQLTSAGAPAVLVVSTETRLPLKRFLEPSFPRLTVLAFQELPAATEIENAGILPLPGHLQRTELVKAAA